MFIIAYESETHMTFEQAVPVKFQLIAVNWIFIEFTLFRIIQFTKFIQFDPALNLTPYFAIMTKNPKRVLFRSVLFRHLTVYIEHTFFVPYVPVQKRILRNFNWRLGL